MGFLSRDKPVAPPAVVRPVVVQPADLAGFSARLEAVERALGSSDAAIRGSVRALSQSVGGFDPFGKEALRIMAQAGGGIKDEIQRPWRWFAKASELANELGDYTLAPRVFIFARLWKDMQPNMSIGDYTDMWLDPIPEDADRAISIAAAEALGHLSDDHVVAQTAVEIVTIGQVRAWI